MNDRVTLKELGVHSDPGCAWHPREDKTEARNAAGNLRDLDDAEVEVHRAKPETQEQVDALTAPLAAEDSAKSPEGEV